MILIEKLHKYLNKEEEMSEDELVFHLPEEQMVDGHIYGKYIMDGQYAFIGKVIMDVPECFNLRGFQVIMDKAFKRNSFTSSLMSIVMPEYRYFDMKSRLQFVKDLHRQVGYDMEEKSLYKDMGYTRLRKQIRENFINNEDIDGNSDLMQIIVDYFSLNVFVISKDKEEKFGSNRVVERLSYVPSVWKKTERNEEYIKRNLSCIVIKQEGKYYPLIRRDKNGLFNWQEHGMSALIEELMRDSEKKDKKSRKIVIKDDIKKKVEELVDTLEETTEAVVEDVGEVVEPVVVKIPKKVTLAGIQEIATSHGISIMKKSEKTGKMLKKTIDELREEIREKV